MCKMSLNYGFTQCLPSKFLLYSYEALEADLLHKNCFSYYMTIKLSGNRKLEKI